MKRLFTFGCSHTNHGYPTWANLLAEEFDEHYNFGLGGTGPFYLFWQISNLIKHKDKWKLSDDDYFVFLLPEENRHDIVVETEHGEHFITNTIQNDKEEWYTTKYKREFSPNDGLGKVTLYIESITSLLNKHNLNHKIILALGDFNIQDKHRYKTYYENFTSLCGKSTPLQVVAKGYGGEQHYYFRKVEETPYGAHIASANEEDIEMDGHWTIPIHLQFVKTNFPFYKETNVKKYLDLHDKYITRSYMKDEWWSRKYHYEYWSNGVLFYPHQNKDFPSGSPF